MAEALDVSAVAEAVQEATKTTTQTTTKTTTATTTTTAPTVLPYGWLLKESRSQPGCFYYFYYPTGTCSWEPPAGATTTTATNSSTTATATPTHALSVEQHALPTPQDEEKEEEDPDTSGRPNSEDERTSKRRKANEEISSSKTKATTHHSSRSTGSSTTSTSKNQDEPKQVRVLHILKKHKDSRRPSSWRQAKITNTKQQAKEELQGILDILLEEEGNPAELQATFEELARTESDCSSAKRGGDLGFFGRRKMQPAFEEASFGLQVGELTKYIVETSSGVHLILRLG